MITFKEELSNLSRRFSRITEYYYGYNTPYDLKRKSHKIICYYYLYESSMGFTIMKFFWRYHAHSILEWKKFLETKSLNIFKNKVLPKINIKWNRNYKFKKLLLWCIPKKSDKDIYSGKY